MSPLLVLFTATCCLAAQERACRGSRNDIARTLPSNYKLPGKNKVGGPLLDNLHRQNYASGVTSLLKESRTFGVCLYGDMATIGKFPLFNFLGAGVNNPYALLAIVDQSDQAAAGKKKDAPYIARLALPIVEKLENTEDHLNRTNQGVVDLVAFNGAKNVQQVGQIIAKHFPRVTVIHGAEHGIALFFKDVFGKVKVYKMIVKINRKLRNVFGSTRHAPTGMLRAESKKHSGGRSIGFIKTIDVRWVLDLCTVS